MDSSNSLGETMLLRVLMVIEHSISVCGGGVIEITLPVQLDHFTRIGRKIIK